MLESKHHMPFGYVLNLNGFKSFPVLTRKCYRELLYLLMPEDTTIQGGGRRKDAAGLDVSNTRSIIKVLFWVVISITMSMVMGQLK